MARRRAGSPPVTVWISISRWIFSGESTGTFGEKNSGVASFWWGKPSQGEKITAFFRIWSNLWVLRCLLCFRRFNNDYCPALRGKPKFFVFQVWICPVLLFPKLQRILLTICPWTNWILQACRGDERDYGILPPAKSSMLEKPSKTLKLFILICFEGDETDAVASRGRTVSMSEEPTGAPKVSLGWESCRTITHSLPPSCNTQGLNYTSIYSFYSGIKTCRAWPGRTCL